MDHWPVIALAVVACYVYGLVWRSRRPRKPLKKHYDVKPPRKIMRDHR